MPYPDPGAYERGVLEVGDGHRIAFECAGSPSGKPAVVVHGGPGSGCTPWHRTMFDPDRYRIVLFDQRGCGGSLPNAGEVATDLGAITTQALVGDIERLRASLGVERWLVWGGSWGSTLGLAYAVAHPSRVSELVLWGVTTGRRSEVDRVFRGGLSDRFADAWAELRSTLPPQVADADVPAAYASLLRDPDHGVRTAAARSWCRWESAIERWPPRRELSERYRDPAFAIAFARLVTHFASNDLFLRDGELLDGATVLRDVPVAVVAGAEDVQAPLENVRALREAIPHADAVIVEDAGHLADDARIERALVDATDRFAR